MPFLLCIVLAVTSQLPPDADRTWTVTLPIEALDCLLPSQSDLQVGVVRQPDAWKAIWELTNQNQSTPKIDFDREIILFVKNTVYLNRIKLTHVHLDDRTLNLETRNSRSARPIRDKFHAVFLVMPRSGIASVRLGDQIFSIK